MKLGKRGIGTKKTHVKQCYQSRHFLQWVMWKSASANICSWRPNSAGIPVRGSRLADVSVLMPGHDNCVILLSGTCARTGTISGQWHKLDPAPDTIRCTERARNFDDIKTTAPGRAPLRWYRGCCTGDAHKFDYIRATAPGRAQIRWYHVPTPGRLFTIRRNCKYATKPPDEQRAEAGRFVNPDIIFGVTESHYFSSCLTRSCYLMENSNLGVRRSAFSTLR